jgi:HSP20 family molecular chaperone IbpA
MNHYFTHFDKLFNEIQWGFDEPQPQQVKDTCRLPKYPVSNCWLDSDMNTLNFEFAIAGYKEDSVKVIGGKNSFTIKAQPDEDFVDNEVVLHRGISRRPIDFTIKVDEQYDVKKTKVSCSNGILRVSAPKAKDAQSVMLFG